MEELDYLDLKNKITKINKKKETLHTLQVARLRQVTAQLEALYPDLIRLAELFVLTGNVVIPEGIEVNGIKCFFSDSSYSFSFNTNETWEYSAAVIVDVDLKRKDGTVCQIKVSDPPFGYVEAKEIILANLINQFVKAYPEYEKNMLGRIEKWIKEQRKLIKDGRF